MEGRFPFKTLAKYPHMKPEDIKVWQRFIEKNRTMFDTCDYDVCCGKGRPQNPDHPPEIQRDGRILTMKKIDVVAYWNDIITLIEVKPIADARGLGQILTYRKLWMDDHPDEREPVCAVVCGEVESEMFDIYTDNGVILWTA